MTHTVMLSLLNRAANGNEMLALIDSFGDNQPAQDEAVSYTNQPTLESIEFWPIVKWYCASLIGGTVFSHWCPSAAILHSYQTKQMDFDTSLWDEIQDMPGEIFDMEDFNEMKQELFGLIDACIELEGNWPHKLVCSFSQLSSSY